MKNPPPLIVGNWKMNPALLSQAKSLFTAVKKGVPKGMETTVVAAAPSVYLSELQKLAKTGPLKLGAQRVHSEPSGAFTGEISLPMLRQFSVSHVIIGHSERRALGLTDEQVRAKLDAVLKSKITPIVCLGEEERDNQGNFFSHIESQLHVLTDKLPASALKRTVIAYEPIWAIGTGKNATADDVKEMQLFILSFLSKRFDRLVANSVQLLYGGSVNARNAEELHRHGGMNGFLVGGASLRPNDFVNIVKTVVNIKKA